MPDHETDQLRGLTAERARELLETYGRNEIREENKRTLLKIFIEQFENVLIILLMAAAALAFVLGEVIDGSLISAIVILNALFGVYQENKAEAAISALKEMTKTNVRVLRDGAEIEVPSEEIVPGDVIFIEEGVKIAADGVVRQVSNLEVNEAGLTGESLPVSKATDAEVFAGTIVTRGRGLIEVTDTGMKTKFGEIAASLSKIDTSKTLLEKKLESFTKILGFLGVGCSFLVIILSYLQGSSLFTSVLLGVSLAVAVVPEGLPAVMTITLSLGVREMAKRKAVLRKLSAIEALGSITVIATDKTGTLTTNSMRVKQVWLGQQTLDAESIHAASGAGSPDGAGADSHANAGAATVPLRAQQLLVETGLLCSTASLAHGEDGDWQILGDPTEGALLILGEDAGYGYQTARAQWQTLYEQPFNSVDKRMSVTVRSRGEANLGLHGGSPDDGAEGSADRQATAEIIRTYSKGAVESILARSSQIIDESGQAVAMTDERRAQVTEMMQQWASEGLRVLAVSIKDHDPSITEQIDGLSEAGDDREQKEQALDAQMQDQVLVGMVAMYDPPRPEAHEALEKAYSAGISVTMVTGDNPRTAEAIGRSIGLFHDGDEVLTGAEVEELSDEQLKEKLATVRIFARVSPFHKSRIVKSYQELGEIVAVTGDGVNDSIALKQADVGVAMGKIGTDVARETADMVLTDDNFATLINAVEEGRNIIKNIRNAIKYLLSTNVVEAIVIIVGIMLGFPKLFTAVQLLYINLASDGIPSLVLAFSPREDNVMQRKPEKQVRLLTPFDIKYILGLGAVASVIVLGSFFFFVALPHYGVDPRAEVFVVLALIQPFFMIDLWLSHQSYFKHWRSLIGPTFIGAFIYPFVLLYFIMTNGFAAGLFDLEPMTTSAYLICVAIAALILIPITIFTHTVRRSTA